MPEKFLNKYRIPSARLQDWDYKSASAYFITICTHNREHYFGEIKDDNMQLSVIGKIAESEWMKTPMIRPDMNLQLGEFVVMPNHFHAILIIGQNVFNAATQQSLQSETCNVQTLGNIDARDDGGPPLTAMRQVKNKFAPQTKNLASIVRGFKSSVTTRVKKLYGHSGNADFDADDPIIERAPPTSITAQQTTTAPFAWQSRFHDHVIRDTESFERIQQYIANNPANWKKDKFHKGNQIDL